MAAQIIIIISEAMKLMVMKILVMMMVMMREVLLDLLDLLGLQINIIVDSIGSKTITTQTPHKSKQTRRKRGATCEYETFHTSLCSVSSISSISSRKSKISAQEYTYIEESVWLFVCLFCQFLCWRKEETFALSMVTPDSSAEVKAIIHIKRDGKHRLELISTQKKGVINDLINIPQRYSKCLFK